MEQRVRNPLGAQVRDPCSCWTAFSLGGGRHPSQAFGRLFIDCDVAVAGAGNFLIGGRATFDGDVYGRSDGTVLAIDHAVISGSIFYDQDALLDNGVNDALPRPTTLR